jgi:predicted nucleotidyltransferase
MHPLEPFFDKRAITVAKSMLEIGDIGVGRPSSGVNRSQSICRVSAHSVRAQGDM